MINDVTWKFIKANEADYRRLQELVLHHNEVFEAMQIIQRMMENIPKSKVDDIFNVIENHHAIYQNTKNKTAEEKQRAMALFVAIAGGAIAETQMYNRGFDGKTTAIFTDDTISLINAV